MGLEILFRDSIKYEIYRQSDRFNLLSKVCGQFAFSLMPDLRVVLALEGDKIQTDRGIDFNRLGKLVYEHRAYIQSSSLKFNSIFSNNIIIIVDAIPVFCLLSCVNLIMHEMNTRKYMSQLLTIDFFQCSRSE